MKIKYINYLLCVVAVIASIYIIITKDTALGIILKDLSIILTIPLLYYIDLLFKIKIDEKIKFIYILFVFSAHFLGATVELYNKIECFDKINHTLSGVLTAYFSLILLNILNKYDSKSKLFNVIYMISVTLAVAAIWEIFEYTANIIFGGDAQRVLLTGVNDTMQDIIVAFLGSIMVCVMYLFYSEKDIFKFRNVIKR